MGKKHEMRGRTLLFPWLYNCYMYVLCCGLTHSNYLVTSSVSYVKRYEALKFGLPSNIVHYYIVYAHNMVHEYKVVLASISNKLLPPLSFFFCLSVIASSTKLARTAAMLWYACILPLGHS